MNFKREFYCEIVKIVEISRRFDLRSGMRVTNSISLQRNNIHKFLSIIDRIR